MTPLAVAVLLVAAAAPGAVALATPALGQKPGSPSR